MHTTFTRFDRVRIGSMSYQPISQDEETLKFMRLDGSGAVERFSYLDLAQLRGQVGWRYERNYFALGDTSPAWRPDGSRLAALDAERLNRVLYLHDACIVLHDLHLAGELALTYRSVEQNRARIQQVVSEREGSRNHPEKPPRGGDTLAARHLPCAKTLLRYYRRFRLAGHSPDALVPSYGAIRRPVAIADPEAERLLCECVWTYADPEKPKRAQVVRHTQSTFKKENERRRDHGLRELVPVSRRTIERRINRLDPFTVDTYRLGADRARLKHASYGSGLPRLFPMQRIEIDEWQVDLITFFKTLGIAERIPPQVRDRLPKGRRWLCAAIDCATRCFVGLRLAERPTSAEAIALLRMAVSDKSNLAREIGAKTDWAFHGGLGVVATDAGSAFQSDEFQTAVSSLHGRLEFPPIRVPELRGTIERAFGTLAGSVMPLLSGRTFANTEERGDYDSVGRAVLDDEGLLRVLLTWVIDVYHNAPHGGLRGQTPANRWRELARERFAAEPPDAHTRRTALGVPLQRIQSARGIQFFANHYYCPELQERRRRSRDRKTDIRVDPDDIGAISVRIAERWYPAPAVDGDLAGVPLVAWREAFTRLLQRHRDQAELSGQIRDDAIAAIRAQIDLKVRLLLPSSMQSGSAEIETLDRTHFHGRSFVPAPASPEADIGNPPLPFGTAIVPLAPAEARLPRPGQIDPAPPADPSWRMEDE